MKTVVSKEDACLEEKAEELNGPEEQWPMVGIAMTLRIKSASRRCWKEKKQAHPPCSGTGEH